MDATATKTNNEEQQQQLSLSVSIISSTGIADTKQGQKPIPKRILIVDDDPDITLTFKAGLESKNKNNNYSDSNRQWEVYTYNDPVLALAEFKPNFYNVLLVDINMPYMNGFELSQKILQQDVNVRVYFVSAAVVNEQALRELSPNIEIGCYIQKPVTIDYLTERLLAELCVDNN